MDRETNMILDWQYFGSFIPQGYIKIIEFTVLFYFTGRVGKLVC